MSAFTEKEIEYIKEQRLGRMATVDAEDMPHVAPVGFRFNEELDTIDIGGHVLGATRKLRDAGATGTAAFVVDDVLPPWRARGAEVRGRAEVYSQGGSEVMEGLSEEMMRIFPRRVVDWGLDSGAFRANSRSVG